MPSLDWWLHSPRGLAARIALGMAVFVVLALTDLICHGRRATRYREYLLLLAAVVAGMAYGAINDQITCRISWEYFYYGKELAPRLGLVTPPDNGMLEWEAAKVGMKATWSAGLIFGVLLLLANNPSRGKPQLPDRALLAWLPRILLSAAICGAILGEVGYLGGLARFSADFPLMLREDLWRPRRFMCVYGIHLGGYVGGMLGAAWAVISIRRRRVSTAESAEGAETEKAES